MTPTELITFFQERGVVLAVHGEHLRVEAPAGALAAADRELLRARKAELVALLRNQVGPEAHRVGPAGPLPAPPPGLAMPSAHPERAVQPTGVAAGASCAGLPSVAAGPRESQCSDRPDAPPGTEIIPHRVPPWDDATHDLIRWFQAHRDRLPQAPFALHPWVKVDAPATFYGALEQDIAAGPRGARARTGALATDLHRLRELFPDSDQSP
jgi:hypothetical protein